MIEDSIANWQRPSDVPLLPQIDAPAKRGLIAALVLFGGFGGWAAIMPLDSAAVAPGFVRVESHHRTVQHLEGGIVKDILVREGDLVKEGQVLLRLTSVENSSALGALRDQDVMLKAQMARLAAERNGAATITWPAELVAPDASQAATDAIATQQKAFEARQTELRTGVGQLAAEIDGHRAQITSLDQQINLLNSEIRDVSGLFDQGLTTRPRLSQLQRDLATATGQKGAELSGIERGNQQISDLRSKRAGEIQSETVDTQQKLTEIEAKMQTSGDRDERMLVKAPSSGRIVNMKVFTAGGVITAGEPIMDIVPDTDQQVIEAHVRPNDIDVVHKDLPARVVLTAYKSRITPTLDGKVINVSADALVTKDNQEYYSVDVLVDAKELAKADEKLVLYPGMPVETMIVTGKRTLLGYLLQPLTDTFRRAFREQ